MTTQTFEYCILRFCPSDIRAEAVNVGLVVFKPDCLDIRMIKGTAKIRALVSGFDDDLLPGARSELKRWAAGSLPVAMRYNAIKSLAYFNCSPLGAFDVQNAEEYRKKIKALFKEWVAPLSSLPSPSDRGEQLFFKLRRKLDRMKVLSSYAGDIDFGMVMPRYPLDATNRIFAEYAYRHGNSWNVIETLNLSLPADRLKRALAYKAFVFEYAKQLLGENVHTHLIYEGVSSHSMEEPLVKTASRHADSLINLESDSDTGSFFMKVQQEATPNYQLPLH